MTKLASILIAGSLLLAGCSMKQAPGEKTDSISYSAISLNPAFEFMLQDGTRCVALYRGGVDCDWRQK